MAEHAKPGAPGDEPKGGLAAELASLKKFKGRIDDLLTTLGESDGAPTKVADTGLSEAALGKNFNAAGALYKVYHDVQSDLATLAKLLNDQIDALSSAVLDAHGGYANTDAEERDKLWAIHDRMQRQYDPKLDPHGPAEHQNTSRTGERTPLTPPGQPHGKTRA
ncbi:hypothetical protein [Streptomyces albireticuli]|uniref:Uncharacterized protein n=1 Tax=Streptomyces albireticuli TaxID=1940 RepID=A0A2A2D5U5_9ACTN|nr:hypothetical protein [Streptomyces albireticuli]MCD9141491.1 hypothetical protein [Streptomyces albireticuli]MCD9164258.1 hypothetical protein [Streptomyces albireticuli]MCD9189665.1 hypothetical protein [Streptomyces albireticuli]PAU46816.1 hypothetical protein CK936_22100 [Streptomyces albireticuli]